MATILSGSSTMFSKLATARIVTFGPRSSLRVEDYVGGANALLSKAAEIGHGGAVLASCDHSLLIALGELTCGLSMSPASKRTLTATFAAKN